MAEIKCKCKKSAMTFSYLSEADFAGTLEMECCLEVVAPIRKVEKPEVVEPVAKASSLTLEVIKSAAEEAKEQGARPDLELSSPKSKKSKKKKAKA